MGMKRPLYTDVIRAALRLEPYLKPTPTMRSDGLPSLLKLENLQVTGAYKVRGALNALLAQMERDDHRPLITASAGNHSAGLAWAARRLGLTATAVVPVTAPQAKVESTRRLGAKVIVHGDSFEASQEHAYALAMKNGWRFLPAFDDPDVIAGQGTIALEILRYRPDVVLVPIGGGGLAAGVGLVLKEHGVRLVGVQVKGVDAMNRSLTGAAQLPRPRNTIADGIRVSQPGRLTRVICAEVLQNIVTVEESHLQQTMVRLFTHDGIITEGAGALASAALHQVDGERKLAIVSGGNIDPVGFERLVKTHAGETHSVGRIFSGIQHEPVVEQHTHDRWGTVA
jgi:threonine dehydratase